MTMQSVLTTSVFERQAQHAGLSETEIEAIVTWLSLNPLAGDLVSGTGGARKVRFASAGKGKSGGYRTIHYFGGDDVPLFLLSVISKGQRADLSQAERNGLAAILPRLAELYRAGVVATLAERKRKS